MKCDLHGTLTATLEWKKQTVSGDVPVPDSVVSVIKDRNIKRTRAVLKIKYAQMEDSGVYKCVSKAFGKTHFKLAYITVKGNSFFFNWLDVALLAYAQKMIVLLISLLVTWFAFQLPNRATLWGWGGGAEEEKKPFLLDPHFWKSLLLAGYPWKRTTGAVIEFPCTVIDWKSYLRDSVSLWTKLRLSAYRTK